MLSVNSGNASGHGISCCVYQINTIKSPGFIGPWRKDHLRQRLVQTHTLRTGRMYSMNAVKAAASAVMVAQMRTTAVQIAPG